MCMTNCSRGASPPLRRGGPAGASVAGRRPLHVLAVCLFIAYPIMAETPAAQHFQTGLAYERLGRIDEAYTELQLAFALEPGDPTIDLALGVVACRLGRLEAAQRALEKAISINPDSVAAYYHLA